MQRVQHLDVLGKYPKNSRAPSVQQQNQPEKWEEGTVNQVQKNSGQGLLYNIETIFRNVQGFATDHQGLTLSLTKSKSS